MKIISKACGLRANDMNHRQYCNQRRGVALIYFTVLMIVLLGVCSLGVDLGRIQVAKAQLQNATDAAARYGAVGMRSSMLSTSGAIANTAASLSDNKVDGRSIPFTPATDLATGIWNSSAGTFTPTTDLSLANAVRVDTAVVMGDSNHVMTFLSIFGKTITVHAESIAMISGQDGTTYVSGRGNPWLAGMPSATVCTDFRSNSNEMDTAGNGPNDVASPAVMSLSSLNISAGSVITFDGVTGQANFDGSSTTTTNGNADGDASRCVTLGSPSFNNYTYFNSPTNGIANIKCPINALVACFLDDSAPTSTSAPSPLDFSTSAARDYISLSPQLKQPFFVGDGRKSTGEIQQIVVPAGATRMFIADMDGWQYWNNTGGFNLTVHAVLKVSTVAVK